MILALSWAVAALLITVAFYELTARSARARAERAEATVARYRTACNDLVTWCAHYSPHARVIASHVVAVGEGLPLNAGTPSKDEPCTVQGLREQLRRIDAQ